jgi:hypothetical protein
MEYQYHNDKLGLEEYRVHILENISNIVEEIEKKYGFFNLVWSLTGGDPTKDEQVMNMEAGRAMVYLSYISTRDKYIEKLNAPKK